MTEADLIRFVNAQADVYDQVVKELSEGRKRSHWMWFIFPKSRVWAIVAWRTIMRSAIWIRRNVTWRAHFSGVRLREDMRLMMRHKGKSALEILGSPDDLKFRSCLTLFAQATSDDTNRSLFTEALDQFYGGKADPRTLELLRSTSPRNISS